jgi:hypothetical protein
MAIALVSHTLKQATDPDTVTTDALDSTGANGLIAIVADYQASTISTVSDSKSNSGWTRLTAYEQAVGSRVAIWYCKNPTSVGSGHTATYSGNAGTFAAICFLAFSGCDPTTFYDTGKVSGTGAATPTSLQPGSLTPSTSGCLVITGLVIDSVEDVSIDAPFSPALEDADYVAGSFGLSVAYEIQSAATARNPTWTLGTSTPTAATTMAVFVSDGLGGGGGGSATDGAIRIAPAGFA